MFISTGTTGLQKTTSYRVVLPFYIYAAVSFLVSCILLLGSTGAMYQHYFHPHTLAITHLMALGWGTMIILGASHQLVPVLIEGRLYSETLGLVSFVLAATGIPLLVCGFYFFHLGWPLQSGAILLNAAILSYLLNLYFSIRESRRKDVYSIFVFTAALWLFSTSFFGLLLVFNFTASLLPSDSLEYLPIHAHMGLVGWFLLLVIGVGSKLIPMFLISKYTSPRKMWWIFILVNCGLAGFIVLRILHVDRVSYYSPLLLVVLALAIFVSYCYKAYKERIRKQVDDQMKISLLSVALLFVPVICLLVVIGLLAMKFNLVLLYGFCIFFGWITAIILGMTFKTLPFIVWNKVYHNRAGGGKTPVPKELFSQALFRWMAVSYLLGFILFVPGLVWLNDLLLRSGAAVLLASSIFYSWNVAILIFHQPLRS